ncbi:MAG: SDR family NAD(P)-dependent oxidoreductase [Bacteroidota bacterium]|nr:SDR family NAD(P)-dependent oxidoreductase [Bacteroidota bacterium]MDP4214428.1 SDR family NAD(P)-dependent oxidoreductase [Bacteroidota bacterium]MDP4252052.1 SDR family NAD(P)-dependent oxidoreductase [Bacteroidota bacterium]
MNKRFENKIAIVTGAAVGIGKAVAQRLGKEGATLALFDINAGLLQKAVDELEQEGLHARGYVVDVGDESRVSESVMEVEKQWGKIDILVHAAGIVGPTSTKITAFAAADFDNIYRINLRGTFLMAKATLMVMEKSGVGRILLIASIAGKEGNPGMVGYSSTKAGVIGLVKGIAKEFATTRILINGLAPALIETPMNLSTSKEQLEYMVSKIPMHRMGTVEEVAAMSCFIVSDENSFSTGFIYDISGGRATY